MEEENTPQIEENRKEMKFSLWFYIAIALCIIVFVIVSAITKKICYLAAAIGFAVLCAELLRLFLKSKRVFLIVVVCVCAAAFALLFALWIMRLCGLG